MQKVRAAVKLLENKSQARAPRSLVALPPVDGPRRRRVRRIRTSCPGFEALLDQEAMSMAPTIEEAENAIEDFFNESADAALRA